MRRYNLLVRDLLRDSIQGYRKSQSYTQEAMAEKLRLSPRSYADQEHGEYGFSATSLLFFMSLLPERETLELIREFERLVEEEDGNGHVA